MATPGAASGEGCSESPGRLECVLVDPIRHATLKLAIPPEAGGREAGSVLRLDAPGRVRRFLAAVAGRIHASPYETYSRYLEPGAPFKSCDQTLDRILEGDGGNCAEKAMALYFIAHAYGIR